MSRRARGRTATAVLLALTATVAATGASTPPVQPPSAPGPRGPVNHPPVVMPSGAPRPTVKAPAAKPAAGWGAHAVVTSIPDSVWASMQGRSWHSGCLARTSLRYITVNYWGFDGRRHRGELIMAARNASATASAFTALYNLGFPIRSMVLPDRFGRNRRGPGADDYRSMAADNTSGFNCRYIDGKESQRAWSPHAFGEALDINPWEDPYVSRIGTLPNSWWLSRNRRGPEVFRARGPAVVALARYGFRWGASYRDFQHFQR
jgi:hypothetical protein